MRFSRVFSIEIFFSQPFLPEISPSFILNEISALSQMRFLHGDLGTIESERSNALERIVENGHGTVTLTHQKRKKHCNYMNYFCCVKIKYLSLLGHRYLDKKLNIYKKST
jgi:hypothetical protein